MPVQQDTHSLCAHGFEFVDNDHAVKNAAAWGINRDFQTIHLVVGLAGQVCKIWIGKRFSPKDLGHFPRQLLAAEFINGVVQGYFAGLVFNFENLHRFGLV